jgi:hypothetical protein
VRIKRELAVSRECSEFLPRVVTVKLRSRLIVILPNVVKTFTKDSFLLNLNSTHAHDKRDYTYDRREQLPRVSRSFPPIK